MFKQIKQKLLLLAKSQLFKGGLAFFAASMIANLANYFYHFFAGRILTVAEYGALESVISLIYFLNIPITTLNLYIVNQINLLKSQNNAGLAGTFYFFLRKKLLFFSSLTLAVFFLLSWPLAGFLHLQSGRSIIFAFSFAFFYLFFTVDTGVLSGFLKFKEVAFLNLSFTLLKVLFACLFFVLGFSVDGGIAAFLLGGILAFLMGKFFIRKIFSSNSHFSSGKITVKNSFLKESLPLFLATSSFASFYTVDIVLARHFLDQNQSGLYASLAVLGKIIFYFISPVSQVLFSTAGDRFSQKKTFWPLLKFGFLFCSLACCFLVSLYFLFPRFVIGSLYGSKYLSGQENLGLFSLFLTFYSLSYLIVNFFLATRFLKVAFLPLIANLVQIILILFFHQNIFQIVLVCTLVSGVMLASLIFLIFQKYSFQKKGYA